jgi:hypothetical protein
MTTAGRLRFREARLFFLPKSFSKGGKGGDGYVRRATLRTCILTDLLLEVVQRRGKGGGGFERRADFENLYSYHLLYYQSEEYKFSGA